MKKIFLVFCIFLLVFSVSCKKTSKASDSKKVLRQFTPGCSDSDNGVNEKTSGFVNGTYDDGVQFEQRDSCVGPFLVEYFCLESVPANKNIKCENCKEGICLDK